MSCELPSVVRSPDHRTRETASLHFLRNDTHTSRSKCAECRRKHDISHHECFGRSLRSPQSRAAKTWRACSSKSAGRKPRHASQIRLQLGAVPTWCHREARNPRACVLLGTDDGAFDVPGAGAIAPANRRFAIADGSRFRLPPCAVIAGRLIDQVVSTQNRSVHFVRRATSGSMSA